MSRAAFTSVAIACGAMALASCAQAAPALMLVPAMAAAGTAAPVVRRKPRRLNRVRRSISLMEGFPRFSLN